MFQQAKKIKSPHLVIYIADNVLGCSRIGIAVAKSRVSKAVARNKIKRQIRESFRTNLILAPLGFDIVVVVQAGFNPLPKGEQRKILDDLWNKLAKYRK